VGVKKPQHTKIPMDYVTSVMEVFILKSQKLSKLKRGKNMYKIIRFYFNKPGCHKTIKSGLTLKEAQAHCQDKESSSSTCTNSIGKRRTLHMGWWFDGYEET
jgi:hypothetical protein